MVERHPIWPAAYADTYPGSEHHSNRDRDADSICDTDLNNHSEPGAVFYADVDGDIDPFAERDPHSFSNSIAEPGTHINSNGDRVTDTHRDISPNSDARAILNAWRAHTHPSTDRPEPGWSGRRP